MLSNRKMTETAMVAGLKIPRRTLVLSILSKTVVEPTFSDLTRAMARTVTKLPSAACSIALRRCFALTLLFLIKPAGSGRAIRQSPETDDSETASDDSFNEENHLLRKGRGLVRDRPHDSKYQRTHV